MTEDFSFYAPIRLIAGKGSALKVADLAEEYGAKKILILTGRHVERSAGFQRLRQELEKRQIPLTVRSDTLPEPPAESVDALANYVRGETFGLVAAVGGGSVMDTAKAVCMLKTNPGFIREYLFGGKRSVKNEPLPLVCIPTTAGSGSEVTDSSVIADTKKKSKLSVTSPLLIPKAAILDPTMQTDMPPVITAGTEMDALTHAIESYTSKHANPVSDIYARAAIRMIGGTLPRVWHSPNNLDARMDMAIASSLAAVAFVNGGLGAVHGISQAIGGIAHTPHGISNAILLPAVMAVNREGNPEKFADIAALLGENTVGLTTEQASRRAVEAVARLRAILDIPEHTSEIGVTKSMFPEIVDGTMAYRLLWMNPVAVTPKMVEQLLEATL